MPKAGTVLSLISAVLYNELWEKHTDATVVQPANSSLGVFLLLFLTELHMMDSVEDNIVALVKEHPTGIPLKRLARYYKKKYHQKLTLSSGFDSVTSLIASLDSELVIVGQVVIHKDNPCNTQVGAQHNTLFRTQCFSM